MMTMTLNGLGREDHPFRTSIGVQEAFLDFQELVALLISEEERNGTNPSSGNSNKSTFYSNIGRGRRRGKGC